MYEAIADIWQSGKSLILCHYHFFSLWYIWDLLYPSCHVSSVRLIDRHFKDTLSTRSNLASRPLLSTFDYRSD